MTALAAGALLPATAAAGASASAKDSATLNLTAPDPAQLGVARVEVKTPGVKKPRLKVKLENAGELSGDAIAVAQATRPQDQKKRAVAIIATGTIGQASARAAEAARGNGVNLEVELFLNRRQRSALVRPVRLIDIRSLSIVNTLGPDPADVRDRWRNLLGLGPDNLLFDDTGRTSLLQALPGLKPIGGPRVLAGGTAIAGIPLEYVLNSAIASAAGPPATLDAGVYSVVTGRPVPSVDIFEDIRSPGNPNLTFSGTRYTTDVIGRQVSPTGPNPLVHDGNAQCAGINQEPGSVASVAGPGGVSLLCGLPTRYNTVFFSIPTGSPTVLGQPFAFSAPFPTYPGLDPGFQTGDTSSFGEAIAGPGVSRRICPVTDTQAFGTCP